MTFEIPAHQRIDIDPVCRLIQRSIAFSDWAAGEGICPGTYKDPRRAEKNPDEFLHAYEMETHDDQWLSIHSLLAEAFKSLDDENGKLKCELNQYAWERDMALDALKAGAAQRIENVAKALAGAAWKRLSAGDSNFAKMKYPDGVSQYMEEQWPLYEADALDVFAALPPPVEQAPQPEQIIAAAEAGWNACRRQVYLLSEDYTERTNALKAADTVEGNFYRGQYDVAKSFARAFNAFEARDCDYFKQIDFAALSSPVEQSQPDRIAVLEAENARMREALDRQGDNMAFVINHVTLPAQYYEKFMRELAEDRAALSTKGDPNGN